MIAIIDYDAGNIKSVEKALISLGQEVCVTRDADEILQADKVILPGVGAFGDAMEKLHRYGLVHSYYLKAEDPSIVKATTEYGVSIDASVEQENVFACQFHPEKSSDAGLQILKNFIEL